LIPHYFSNLIGPISIGILPLRIWRLLVSFHVSVRRMICIEHWINNLSPNLRTTELLSTNLLSADLLASQTLTSELLTSDLLAVIHRLIDWPLGLKPRIDLALLEPCSLMIRLGCLRKVLLPKPSIISVHRQMTGNWA